MYTNEIIERRNAVLKDWDAFWKEPPPRFIAEVIERRKTKLPDRFVAWTPGIVVASYHLLWLAHYRPGSRRPPGWSPGQPDVFTKVVRNNRLLVRGCGKFWTVEREIDEVLVFTHGSMPIFTRTCEAAMRLAEYFHLHPDQVPDVRWVVATPDGIRSDRPLGRFLF